MPGAMAGITQKDCVALFPLCPSKNPFWGVEQMWINGTTEANEKFRVLVRSHVNMMTTLAIIIISVIQR